MPYELIELTTANIVGVYATEDEALRDVAETVQRYGPDTVADAGAVARRTRQLARPRGGERAGRPGHSTEGQAQR